ncbi:HTH domain-containing protein [Echinicola sp. CAU 1574]|uniref:HTH domain-containing protein n=1 Tax=Echinicola arenosa TaxID=2774144 RepID=A0ABR9AMA4_9BACT|nr:MULTISPECIES: HTH domain-containing protein [Echinicola]MBD8489892.1 HTH domain-containing protein [Echinicola arenosa]
MNFIKHIERIQLINKLVKEGKTGSPEDLSNRLGISRRQLYNHLESLKDMGLEVAFSRKINSFYYVEDKHLEMTFSLKVIGPEEAENIYGGVFLPLFDDLMVGLDWGRMW